MADVVLQCYKHRQTIMRKRLRIPHFIMHTALCLAFIHGPVLAQPTTSAEAQRIIDHVRVLASDSCQGRGPGSGGIEKAAAYVMEQFKSIGVRPAGRASFGDPFTMTTGVKLAEPNSVSFSVVIERPGVPVDQTRPITVGWKLGADYQPYGFSETGSAKGEVVFAGYGLSTSSYDDYSGVDVKGKVVILLRGLPGWADADQTLRQLATVRSKTTIARDKGAVAVIFVNKNGDSADVLSRFGLDRLGKYSGILALQARRSTCAKVFPPKGTSLFVAETDIEKTKKPRSFQLANVTANVAVALAFEESTTSNIIGMIEGTDPTLKNEYVVVGAHYDHIGMGDENSLAASNEPAIHHGADDNASGTAGIIELSRAVAASPLKRSVLFMAFSGEEKGLLGSKHWVTTPTVPLDKVTAMINLDMIGRLKDGKLNIQGVGTSSRWPAVIDSAKKGLPLTITTTADGFGPSDHSSFTGKGIPVLFFFTGLHGDYHRPSDTWDKVNAEGQVTVLSMVERAMRIIGDAPDRPEFAKGADKPASTQSSSMALKVTFGVVPDYSDDPQGLHITGVKPGSPAEKGGLQADDIITAMGQTTIKNIYDLMAALGSFKPGDTTTVKVIRDEKPLSLNVTFTGK
ncbi:MAG: M28 family peptidase [Candidatus Kapabacteria bacterium]|nr:M28 family peptidase [Candidatus Kapabacteria bacterium]